MSAGGRCWWLLAVVCCLVLIIASTDNASANGFRNPPAGAAALGADGGKLTFIDDASAIAHNPANLMDVKDRGVLASVTFVDGESELSSPLGSVKTDGDLIMLPNIFAVMPVKDGQMMAGIALTTPYGQSTEWKPADLMPGVPYYAELSVVDVTPSLACKLTDKISMGLGLDFYTSMLELRLIDPVSGMPNKFEGDGTGLGGNIGLTLQLTESQRLALTYRAAFSIEYDGDADVYMTDPATGAQMPLELDYDSEIDFPSMAAIGYGVELSDSLRVGVDVEWVEFSQNENIPTIVAGMLTDPGAQNWDDVWTAGIAGAWDYSDALTLRCSYKFMESPIPDSTLSPTLPDGDRHIVAAGLGWKADNHTIDLSYAYNLIDDRDVVSAGIPLTYEIDSQLASISYSYSF